MIENDIKQFDKKANNVLNMQNNQRESLRYYAGCLCFMLISELRGERAFESSLEVIDYVVFGTSKPALRKR